MNVVLVFLTIYFNGHQNVYWFSSYPTQSYEECYRIKHWIDDPLAYCMDKELYEAMHVKEK